ncbi:MAG: preprotein translocase subunit YajC [Bacilli bacterium]
MDNVLAMFAQAEAAQPQGGGTSMLIFLVLMFAAMYILMIAPQRKRQKQHQTMISELKTGDEIITIGGAIGTITNVKEKTFIIRFGDNNKMEFLKSAIQEKLSGTDSDSSQSK